jgi:hypothetical protein
VALWSAFVIGTDALMLFPAVVARLRFFLLLDEELLLVADADFLPMLRFETSCGVGRPRLLRFSIAVYFFQLLDTMLDSMWGVVRMLLSLTLLMRCWLLTLFVFNVNVVLCFMFCLLFMAGKQATDVQIPVRRTDEA